MKMLLTVFLAFCLSGFAASSQVNEIQTGKQANLIYCKSCKFIFHLLMNARNEREEVNAIWCLDDAQAENFARLVLSLIAVLSRENCDKSSCR